MKIISTTLLIATVVTVTSLAAVAAPDYSRLKKDVSVMTQILKSAFSSDTDCRGCRIRVDGLYLAKQGFLFTVHDVDGRWFHEQHDDESMAFVFRAEELEAMEEIPHMVSQLVSEVTSAIPQFEAEIEQMTSRIDGSTRNTLRDLRRDRRDLQRDLREQEIELIHADDSEKVDIENEIANLEQQMEALEEKEEVIQNKVMAQRDEMRRQADAKREERNQKRREQQEKIETRVLQAFCDYGSTLQSLPSSENVTVIFDNNQRESDADTIYVFARGDVINCNRDKNKLQLQALKYQF